MGRPQRRLAAWHYWTDIFGNSNIRLQGSTGGIFHNCVLARRGMGEMQGRATPGGLRHDFPCATRCKAEMRRMGRER